MDLLHAPLPHGEHWGLNIKSDSLFNTAAMEPFAKPKLLLHTTEGLGFGNMDRVLRQKGAQPHILIDPSTRQVKQYIPFNQISRSLEHPPGTRPTNGAGCIQLEIVGFAAPGRVGVVDVAEESLAWYGNLAACCELIRHRVPFRPISRHSFLLGAPRITPARFRDAEGIIGHMHAPSQPGGHWDPGQIKIATLIHLMVMANDHYQ